MSNFNALFWGFFGTKEKIQDLKNTVIKVFFVFEHLFSKSVVFLSELVGSTVGRVGREWFATRGDSLLRQPLR